MHEGRMASDKAEFWERRHEISPSVGEESETEDYQLALLADITDAELYSVGEELSEKLDRFGCFSTSPPEAYHLTVKLFDVAVSPSVADTDDPPPSVRRVETAVSRVLAAYQPFDIQFPQLNLFPDVVYAEVADRGRLAGINKDLCQEDKIAVFDRDYDAFIPHLTLGYFQNDIGYELFVEFLENNRTICFPPFTIETLSLVAYDIGGHPPTYKRIERYEI
ncbi:MAG: 2'-5' RNA ligase family protein [Halovenus sp.]